MDKDKQRAVGERGNHPNTHTHTHIFLKAGFFK
jgi:hypothetical protein